MLQVNDENSGSETQIELKVYAYWRKRMGSRQV